MVRWKLGRAGCGGLFRLERVGGRRDDDVQAGRHRAVSANFSSVILRLANFVTLCVLTFAYLGSEVADARELDPEKAIYGRAVEHCRGNVKRPMALDLDKRVLCF